MSREHSLIQKLDTIVQKLEGDQDTQCIPLEEIHAMETEAQRAHDALLTLYQGSRHPSQVSPQQTTQMEE